MYKANESSHRVTSNVQANNITKENTKLDINSIKGSEKRTTVAPILSKFDSDLSEISGSVSTSSSNNQSIFDEADRIYDIARNPDLKASADLLKIEAEKGSVSAMLEYAIKLRGGVGVSKDIAESQYWFDKALNPKKPK